MGPCKVLVVDDEESFTRLLKLNLEATGRFEVCVVNWAEDALAAAQAFLPDVVLLDIMMPRMVGGDVAAQLRAQPRLASIPIVFLTAAVSRQSVESHAGNLSGYPVLAKPASVSQVIQIIEAQCGLGGQPMV